jgi:hypothetical protein
MSRWLRLIYPAEFARRHADEIAALLETSPEPVRDHLDVAIHAVRLRSEHLMSQLPRHLADVAVAIAIFLLGFVINDLKNGLGELAEHWWSAAAILLVVIACSARAAIGVVDQRRINGSDSAPP